MSKMKIKVHEATDYPIMTGCGYDKENCTFILRFGKPTDVSRFMDMFFADLSGDGELANYEVVQCFQMCSYVAIAMADKEGASAVNAYLGRFSGYNTYVLE